MSEISNSENAPVVSLSTLAPTPGSRRRRKRVGIGEGSGNGKTCGKGHKGQRARAGYRQVAGFEGGQMPLHRRLPKVGFTSYRRVRKENVYSLLTLANVAALESDGEVTQEVLRAHGFGRGRIHKIKLLAGGELSKAVVVHVHAASKAAREAVEKAGGRVELIEPSPRKKDSA